MLNALAQDFIDSGYNLKSLMREIVNSRAYQLSSRYTGTWDPNSETLFARHLVRRLWSEELADSVAQSSGIATSYTNSVWGPVSLAMKLPEPLNTGGSGTAASQIFLDAFLRGNRDDQVRSDDGSISQALDLMNDNFVMQRVNSTAATSLIVKALALPNDQLVNTLFLNVLSRYPTATEMTTALKNLSTQATRTQKSPATFTGASTTRSISFSIIRRTGCPTKSTNPRSTQRIRPRNSRASIRTTIRHSSIVRITRGGSSFKSPERARRLEWAWAARI